jgi:rod shape-determining protein MreD
MTMSRPFSAALLFLTLSVLQTSFFASLPGVLAYTPLVLSSGIYLLQHVGERTGAYWIAGFGLFIDVMGIPSFPAETASYACAALAADASARNLFSNRSWYGLAACGITTALSMAAARGCILLAVELAHPERISWSAYADTLVWNAVLGTALLSIFFSFAGQIRKFLRVSIASNRGRDTL